MSATSHGANHCHPLRSRPIHAPAAAKPSVSATSAMTRPKIAAVDTRPAVGMSALMWSNLRQRCLAIRLVTRPRPSRPASNAMLTAYLDAPQETAQAGDRRHGESLDEGPPHPSVDRPDQADPQRRQPGGDHPNRYPRGVTETEHRRDGVEHLSGGEDVGGAALGPPSCRRRDIVFRSAGEGDL